MKATDIENSLNNNLRVDKIGRIIGKSKVIDEIQENYLKSRHNELMDIRIFVANCSSMGLSQKEALEAIDDFIYNKQIS